MKVWELRENHVYHNGKNPKTIRILDNIDGYAKLAIFRTIQGRSTKIYKTSNGEKEISSLKSFAQWAKGEDT